MNSNNNIVVELVSYSGIRIKFSRTNGARGSTCPSRHPLIYLSLTRNITRVVRAANENPPISVNCYPQTLRDLQFCLYRFRMFKHTIIRWMNHEMRLICKENKPPFISHWHKFSQMVCSILFLRTVSDAITIPWKQTSCSSTYQSRKSRVGISFSETSVGDKTNMKSNNLSYLYGYHYIYTSTEIKS